jgi:hypothetical protein
MAAGGSGFRVRPWVPGNRRAPAAAAAALFLAAGCGGSPEPVAAAPPYVDPGFVEAGDWRLHYALTLARDLPAAIAGSYGIEQRRNLALLTIALVSQDAGTGLAPESAQVEADAVSLTGAREALALSRHDAAGNATWLATLEVRHRVPVTIDIRARATAASPPMRARLTREFRLE